MRWEDFRTSENIEDRRGQADAGTAAGSMLGGTGKLGLGVIVILFLVSQVTGIDFRTLLGGAQMITGGNTSSYVPSAPQGRVGAPDDQMGRFVSKVLAETEDTWSKILPAQKGIQYQNPKLVLYSGTTASGCGTAQSAMGPFYCPSDRKVYLDMSFFQDMKTRYGGGGDFAYAYVIAHEVGHHVQNLMGILPKVHELQQAAASQAEANGLSVRLELMADCLAGVWAANANQNWKILEPGDIEKAMATASAIGDDRLQQAARGTVVPDSFTHGSSVQRQKWLTTGLNSGQIDSCNTFAR
ncbi:MAG: neutral zinc metallopeptidase [Methylobacteriaceae bacterium]|nr:neutral zinc metallopeptidase [Methylobacteriaceae bacterium]